MLSRSAIMLFVFASPLFAACSIVGNNIDQHIVTEGQGRPRSYVDGNGEGRHIVPASEYGRHTTGPFTEMGNVVDKAIFKSLTTRRMESDMAMRDEGGCPDGATKVCSALAGCACKLSIPK